MLGVRWPSSSDLESAGFHSFKSWRGGTFRHWPSSSFVCPVPSRSKMPCSFPSCCHASISSTSSSNSSTGPGDNFTCPNLVSSHCSVAARMRASLCIPTWRARTAYATCNSVHVLRRITLIFRMCVQPGLMSWIREGHVRLRSHCCLQIVS